MLRMIRKYLPAFGMLFAITFFLVMALTALAQVQHVRQDSHDHKGSRNKIEVARQQGRNTINEGTITTVIVEPVGR